MSAFRTLCPGRLPYRSALELQERLIEERLAGREDILLLLEHDPVVTLGRGASTQGLLLSPEEFARRGIHLERISRGGEGTYHGPGQLVGYPIVHLERFGKDLHRYLRLLEEVLLRALASLGLTGQRDKGRTGVWVEGRKIASLGIGVRRWVSWHGFALNVQSQQEGFATIVPCGLDGVRMTSLEEELGTAPSMAAVQRRIIEAFAQTFEIPHAGTYETEQPQA